MVAQHFPTNLLAKVRYTTTEALPEPCSILAKPYFLKLVMLRHGCSKSAVCCIFRMFRQIPDDLSAEKIAKEESTL